MQQTSSSDDDGAEIGTFWLPSAADETVTGRLRYVDDEYQLATTSWLGTPHQFRVGPNFRDKLGPVETVADYAPRVVHGDLEDGTPVTLTDAHMSFVWSDQQFSGSRLVRGAHLDDADGPVGTVRWDVTGVKWLGCSEGEACTERGRLSGEAGRDGSMLTFQAKEPTSLRNLSDRLPRSVSALCQLWTLRTVTPANLRVRVHDACGWLPIEPPLAPRSPQSSDLLPAEDLTVPVVAKWVDLVADLGSLPFVATTENSVLQRDAHTMGAALEGLHRRLHREKEPPLHPLPGSAIDKARSKAAGAAADYLESRGWRDRPMACKRFKDATVHVNQVSYAERLEELLPPVMAVAPGLCGPDEGFPFIGAMTKLRNEQSHHLLEADQFDQENVTRYYVLAHVAKWILQLRLLLEITPRDQLRAALRSSNQFGFALANIDRDPLWPRSYSAYHTFRAAAAV